jgi:thioredoxin reductase (NADPH)
MITSDLLRNVPLLAELPDSELAVIAARAADISLRAGDWLVQEGEVPSFFIVISGRLTVLKMIDGIERVLNHYGAGEFAGELPLLLGAPAIASLRAEVPSRIARLDAPDFRDLIVACSALNAQMLQKMATRIAGLQQLSVQAPLTTVSIVGHRYDLACHDLRDFVSRNHVAFRWYDPSEPGATAALGAAPNADSVYPVVVFSDGRRMVAPTLRAVADALGLQTKPSHKTYDVAIVGGGPAGLAAAVYGASEGLQTILIEREAPGGQAATSSRIENYLGFPTGVSGDELGTRAHQQAKRFGAEIVVGRDALGIDANPSRSARAILLDDGERVDAKSIIIATGVAWRTLDVPGAEALVGRGLYYGAARTEALAMRGLDIFLVGGGNSAGQAAMFFSNYARSVTILIRGDSLEASMSHYLIAQLATKANVSLRVRALVVALEGADHLEALQVEDRDSGSRSRVHADALFVFIGADAQTTWLPAEMIRDSRDYVCTGRDVMDLVSNEKGAWPLPRDPYLLETSIPGIFAVGDVRHGSIKRVASGVGEGSMAIAFVHQYLAYRSERQSKRDREVDPSMRNRDFSLT